MKKWLVALVLILGGIMVFFSLNNPEQNVEDKLTLTREQQDNVVKRIVRCYDIDSIKFRKFIQDKKTGSYHLLFTIDEKYDTGITIREIERLENSTDEIGLNPVDTFSEIERNTILSDEEVDVSGIKITYIGG